MTIDLNKSPLSVLVVEFNRLTGQSVKRFENRKTAIKLLQAVMPKKSRNVTVLGGFKTIEEAIKNNLLKGKANKKAVVKLEDGYRVVCFMTARSKGLEVVAAI